VLFLYEPWLGGVVLKDRFSKLFALALNKKVFVEDMVYECGLEGGSWSLRRRINLLRT
jgi:hypothetical protein